MKKKFFKGFTLAEVLLALAIVGVISSLVMPSIVVNYKKQAMLWQLKKTYKELEHSLLILNSEMYNRDMYSSKLGTGDIMGFFEEYFQISAACKTSLRNGCFASGNYKSIDNSSEKRIDNYISEGGKNQGVLLKSGAAMYIEPAVKASNTPAKVLIDVNGELPPNVGGRDIFELFIYPDYSIDVIPPAERLKSDANEKREELFKNSCLKSSFGEGCFGRILNNNWKIDY